jgi:ABC-type spermidine/putrescine transport system permease subunit I
LGTELGVSIGLAYTLIPYAILPLALVLSRENPNLVQAAMSLGANEFTAWRRISLPLSLPGVGAAAVICFSLAITSFTAPLLLGGGSIKMIANIMVEQIQIAVNFPFAGALGMIVIVVSVALAVMYQRVIRRPGES